MGTSCQILICKEAPKKLNTNFHDFKVILYKHYDGYPSHMEPLLINFCKEFDEVRGLGDFEYCGAWLMHELIKDGSSESSKFLSFGISKEVYKYIDFAYVITPTELIVYKTIKVDHTDTMREFREIARHKLAEEKPNYTSTL